MGLFEILEQAGHWMGRTVGMDCPNQICTEEYRCMNCGYTRYFSETLGKEYKTVRYGKGVDPSMKCTVGDGLTHRMRRVH